MIEQFLDELVNPLQRTWLTPLSIVVVVLMVLAVTPESVALVVAITSVEALVARHGAIVVLGQSVHACNQIINRIKKLIGCIINSCFTDQNLYQ